MGKKSIDKIIAKRCRKINKLYENIVVDFNSDKIHAFRLEIKKLRAILKLLNENEVQKFLKIPAKLKEIYKSVGMVRNIQLLRERIEKQNDKKMFRDVLQQLNDRENKWRKKTQHIVKTGSVVKKKQLIHKVESTIKQNTVKKFVQKKLLELQRPGNINTDDKALHNIRKVLKDITYNWSLIKQYALAAMPVAFQSEDKIDKFIELLGNFQDITVFLKLLNAGNDDIQKTLAPIGLENFKRDLLLQKSRLKKQAMKILNA